jgi:hypothetical protein
MDVQILTEDEYVPSTVTMVSRLNRSIDVVDISTYLPVVHLFNVNTGERLKLDSGTRTSIKYYGYEGILISICYKKIRRGMRTGAMNNMASLDVQYMGKNIHVKLSSNTITSVGTSGYEFGVKVFNLMISHINMLYRNLRYIKSLSEEIVQKNIKWVFDNCVDKNFELHSYKKMLKLIKDIDSDLDSRVINSFIAYIDDFEKNEVDKFKEKIINFINKCSYLEEDITCLSSSIFNSVYHINIFKNPRGKRLPLHILAPYLANKNFIVEFHNWTSEGVNVCFDIEEEKSGSHHKLKEYKHRFTIHERGTMRQCSPTMKKESYKYYLGITKQIQEFIRNSDELKNPEYKKYITQDIQ